jgi:formamidopyrimidine-DNA glycosylase
MPELPDVEIFKRYLDSTALHQRIAGVTVRNQRILRGLSSPRLARALRGRQFQSSRRHGKLLFIQLGSETGWLVFHFGMTGFLKYFKDAKEEPPHTRMRVDFANGTHLAFDCQRLFGKVMLTDDVESFIETSHVGPDALGLDWRQFRDRLAGTNRSIKSVLMDQSKIAGIGNVYSDEILFQSRIHPQAKMKELSEKALRKLHQITRKVLRAAIAAHAEPHRLPQSWLLPFRKDNDPCPGCSGKIHRIVLDGRSAYVCQQCQRKVA